MQAVPILMYHHVSPNPGLVTISPALFKSHMEWLHDHGYVTVGTHELAEFLGGKPLAPKSVVVSFDDGYLDNWVYAYPTLKALGQKAVLFLVTGWVGDGPLRACWSTDGAIPPCPDHRQCKALIEQGASDEVIVRWSEVEQMVASGVFEVHSHTHTHTRWDKSLPAGGAREEALAEDLGQSRETLSQRLGQVSSHLCWPQGYYDEGYVRVAQAAGFQYLYTTEKRVNTAQADPLHLGRVVAKERSASWLGNRVFIWRHGTLAHFYAGLRGK